jgi:two-component system NtrC family sensor kinase
MAGPQVMRQVLVVEDNFEFADLLLEVLTRENCDADHASNGMDALDKLRTGNYDAVVCDLMMPRVDGKSLYRQVEREFPYLAQRFIFITGQTTRQAGYADFIYPTGNLLLEKPFDIEQFRAALRDLFAR